MLKLITGFVLVQMYVFVFSLQPQIVLFSCGLSLNLVLLFSNIGTQIKHVSGLVEFMH